MRASFRITISYSQISVFLAELDNPFNDWRPAHVAQGFSWRPGSVSFRTIDDGAATVALTVSSGVRVRDDAILAIAVPFIVPEEKSVVVASIGDEQGADVPPGDYRLVFQHGRDADGALWCDVALEPAKDVVRAEILKSGPDMTPGDTLLMDADPAV